MRTRRLGAGGPEVSAIGVGAMSFAGVYGRTTEAEAHRLLAAALELGIDHVDTSNVYGMGLSERMIGSFLARAGRDRFRIATKAGIRHDPDSGARSFDNGRAHLTAELEGSLRRLGVEAVDLFYVHRRDPGLPIEEVAETLAGLVGAGKAKAIGFSEVRPRRSAARPWCILSPPCSRSTRSGPGRRSSAWCRPARRSAPRSSPSRRSAAAC